jgi:hypothetical protein
LIEELATPSGPPMRSASSKRKWLQMVATAANCICSARGCPRHLHAHSLGEFRRGLNRHDPAALFSLSPGRVHSQHCICCPLQPFQPERSLWRIMRLLLAHTWTTPLFSHICACITYEPQDGPGKPVSSRMLAPAGAYAEGYVGLLSRREATIINSWSFRYASGLLKGISAAVAGGCALYGDIS